MVNLKIKKSNSNLKNLFIMKTLIILSVFLFYAAMGQAQKVTELEEVKIGFSPLGTKVIQDGDRFSYTIKKRYAAEFVNNPIGFLNENFNIRNFIALVDDKEYDSYEVTFKSSKGHLVANYDDHGNLLSTQQHFKNLLLPYPLRLEVYNANKGWTLIKNNYIANTNGAIIDRAIYKLTLKNGNQKRNVKIDATGKNYAVVSSN